MRRSHFCDFFKLGGKVLYRVKIKYFGDFVDIFVSFRNELFGFFYFEENAIVHYGDVHRFFEDRTQIGSAVSNLCRDILKPRAVRYRGGQFYGSEYPGG